MDEKCQFLSLHASYLPIQVLKTSLRSGLLKVSDAKMVPSAIMSPYIFTETSIAIHSKLPILLLPPKKEHAKLVPARILPLLSYHTRQRRRRARGGVGTRSLWTLKQLPPSYLDEMILPVIFSCCLRHSASYCCAYMYSNAKKHAC